MGALDEGHFHVELENGVKLEVGFDEEPVTLAIEDAVKVVLLSLGEDINLVILLHFLSFFVTVY